MNHETITIGDCLDMSEKKGQAAIIENGQVVGFTKEDSEKVLIDKGSVVGLKDVLDQLTTTARGVSVNSSFETIRKAQDALNIAKGLHKALRTLELTDDFSVSTEDLERIERKHLSVLEEKRRLDRPWKKEV